jgi:cobalamin synthase
MGIIRTVAIAGIDLAIIAIALVYVSFTSYKSEDVVPIILTVFLVYIAVVLITSLLLLPFQGGGGWFLTFCKTALTTGFILWLYPTILKIVLYLLQYQVSAEVSNILFYTVIIRTVARVLLGRIWRVKASK